MKRSRANEGTGLSYRLTPQPGVRACLQLTPRETQVAEALCRGLYPKQIGGELHLSVKTISTYLHRIAAKLRVRSPVLVALWMVKHQKVNLAEIYCGVDECRCECHCHRINRD